MKGRLIGAGVALLVSATSASAATTYTISLNGYCDVFTLTPQDGGTSNLSFVSMNTGCDDGFGFGSVSEANQLGGKFVNMGGVLFAFGDTYFWALQLRSKIKTGNSWYLSSSTDGINFTRVNSGTYTVAKSSAIRPHGKPASGGPISMAGGR